jgi:crotonobetainyl-CoA:carnitine CoA-transferase CaiB-like acyl-CoA transferase
MTVACAKQKFWVALCRALEREDLLDDPRLADMAARGDNRELLLGVLRPLFRSLPTDELVRRLGAHGVPCGPVNDVSAALADPQVEARDGVFAYEHPTFGTVRGAASPLRLGEAPDYRPAPARGADTADVLAELAGLSAGEIEALRSAGAFGPAAVEAA